MASQWIFQLLGVTLFLEHVHHDIDIIVQMENYACVHHAGLLPVSSASSWIYIWKGIAPRSEKILIAPCQKFCTFLALIQLSARPVCGLGDAPEDTAFCVRAGGAGRRKAALLVILILIITAVAVEVAIAQRCWTSQRQQGVLQSGSRQKVGKYFPSRRVKRYTQGPKKIWGQKSRGEKSSDAT